MQTIIKYALIAVWGLFWLLSSTLQAEENTSTSYNGPKDKLHVYLLIGQSNMAGRAPFTEEEAAIIPRCYLFNRENEWEPATLPLNRHSTIRKVLSMQKMNPGYGFSKAMLEADKTISIGLVVNAKGGTKIEQWAKGTKFYDEAIKRVKEAQKTGTLKGILWHQGEGNAAAPAGYLAKLKTLIEDLRHDLGSPNLPFIAGQVKQMKHDGMKAINAQIASLPEAVPFTGFASSEGLTTLDHVHFDPKSMKLLGKRYAEAMQKVQCK